MLLCQQGKDEENSTEYWIPSRCRAHLEYDIVCRGAQCILQSKVSRESRVQNSVTIYGLVGQSAPSKQDLAHKIMLMLRWLSILLAGKLK